MCAIAGFTYRDESAIMKMTDAQSHRGPDDGGIYTAEGISLGHRRLSIIDVSPHGRNPLFNEDRSLALVFNGEIYNYKELRADLISRHTFSSMSDAETILHLYEEIGVLAFEKLNGIFALALWDAKKKELVLARDRLGVKPLYYYFDKTHLYFASEIKAFKAAGLTLELRPDALSYYFTLGYTPQPMTPMKHIWKVPAGQYALFSNGTLKFEKFWKIAEFGKIGSRSTIHGFMRDLFDDSVRHQVLSDRPVGILLSGGIDSSVLTSVARRYLPGKIKTFTVGYEVPGADKFNDDLLLARDSSKYYNTDHHELIVRANDVREHFEDVVYHLDEPINNAVQIASYLLAREASKVVPVVLSGAGGDELFGGYPRYRYSAQIDRWQKLPRMLRRVSLPIVERFTGRKLGDKLESRGVDRYRQFMFRRDPGNAKVFKSGVLDERGPMEHFRETFFSDAMPLSETERMEYIDMMTWMQDHALLQENKMTMAWGVEERVPFLDHRIAELSFRIPMRYKVSHHSTKRIMREAFEKDINPRVLNEPKRGFPNPMAKWLKRELHTYAKEILSPSYCRETEAFFDFGEMQRLVDDHAAERGYHMNLIWGLLTWQVWYRKFLA
ncbi:MAG: asparagine synthase (glutamine-hydrolyzing) [Patescibacteria group bacterium]